MSSNSFFAHLELQWVNSYDTSSALRLCRQAVVTIKSRILYSRLLPVVPHFSPAFSFPLFTRCHSRTSALPLFTHSLTLHMNSFHMTMVLKYGVKEMSVANKYSGAVLWTALNSLQHCSGEGGGGAAARAARAVFSHTPLGLCAITVDTRVSRCVKPIPWYGLHTS